MKLLLLLPLAAFAQTGAIEGVATNKMTKAPVAKVRVKMAAANEPTRNYSATTDETGAYRLERLPVGVYAAWVDPPEGLYGPDPMEMVLHPSSIQVKDGETANFNVELTPPSVLRGRVLAPDGEPAAKARVSAFGRLRGLTVAADEQGRFSFQLPAGRYRLDVRANPSDPWAPTYYPNVTDMARAEYVELPEMSELGGFDIRLQPKGKAVVRGVVRDDAGKPAPGVDLMVGTAARAASDAKGEFELKGIPPGQWSILAIGVREGVRWVGSASIAVSDRDIDRLEIRVHPPFAYTVAVEGVPKERRMSLSIQLQRTGRFDLSPSSAEKNGVVRLDRVYPGTYRVGVFGFVPGHYLKAMLLGDADVTGQPVDLGPGSPELKIVYAPNGGRIAGEVENGAGAKVALVRADRDRYIPGIESMTYPCDEHGKFTITDLRPGDWYLLAYRGEFEDLRDRIFDRGLWRQAASVKVAEGETSTVKISITSF